MFSIEQSAFLQALGKAIGNSLWQVAALWLVYAAVSNVSRLSANRKYQLAAGASLSGFIWFIGSLIYFYATAPLRLPASAIYLESVTEAGNSATDQLLYLYHSIAATLRSLAPYISCAYICMFLLLSVRLNNGFKQIHLFATQGLGKVNVDLRLFVQHHAASLGITKNVQIFTSQHVQSPLTLGFWKPIILLPIASLNHLSTAQVESILLHELAHIRRHDYLVNILLQIAEISLFFNPFMRLLLKQVKQERENSCDDYVLQFQYCPKDYAKALLAIQHNNNTALLALSAKGNQSFQLLNRVKRMVAPQPKAFNYRQQLGLLLLLTMLTLGFTVIIPHPKKMIKKNTLALIHKVSAPQQKETIQITTAQTLPASAVPAPSAPKVPAAFDLVKEITHYQNIASRIDEKAIEANVKKITEDAAKYEALGKEVEAQIKPLTKKIEAWAENLSINVDEHAVVNQKIDFNKIGELKELPAEFWLNLDEKTIASKVNELIKSIPLSSIVAVGKKQHDSNKKQRNNEVNQESIREEMLAAEQAETDRKQAIRNHMELEKAQRQLSEKAALLEQLSIQKEVKQLEALAKLEQLHLGLSTDDRDSTINGLLAKMQKRFKFHISAVKNFEHVNAQPANNQQSKAKCTITISDDDIKFDTDNNWQIPSGIRLNGQNIDVHHEKQTSNGKEENVVIISLNSSK